MQVYCLSAGGRLRTPQRLPPLHPPSANRLYSRLPSVPPIPVLPVTAAGPAASVLSLLSYLPRSADAFTQEPWLVALRQTVKDAMALRKRVLVSRIFGQASEGVGWDVAVCSLKGVSCCGGRWKRRWRWRCASVCLCLQALNIGRVANAE